MIKDKSKSRTSRRDLLKSNSKRSKAQIRDRTRTKAKPYDHSQYHGYISEEVNDGS